MHTMAGTTRRVAESSRGYFPAGKAPIKGFDSTAFQRSLAPPTVVEEKGTLPPLVLTENPLPGKTTER